MSMRKQRHMQFRTPQTGAVSSLSTWLLHCAEFELGEALRDRGPGKAHTDDNHWSPHCGASVLLLVSGFEAWLNETTLLASPQYPSVRKLANCTVRQKYEKIPKRVGGTSIQVSQDLELVLRVRDEVAHFLPLVVSGGVPHWLANLQNQGLLLTGGSSKQDYDFAVKLNSYALAYWGWKTVHTAVTDFLDAVGSVGSRLRLTAANFEGYQSVCPPSGLPRYDAKHKWRHRTRSWLRAFRTRALRT